MCWPEAFLLFSLVAGTGFDFVRSLAFMVVLDVLPRLFLVLFCAIFPVVCRRRCYTVATLLPNVCAGIGKLFEFFGSYGYG